MNKEEIEKFDGFFNKGWCCDLDEIYEIAMKLVEENKQLKEKIQKANEYIRKVLNFNSIRDAIKFCKGMGYVKLNHSQVSNYFKNNYKTLCGYEWKLVTKEQFENMEYKL